MLLTVISGQIDSAAEVEIRKPKSQIYLNLPSMESRKLEFFLFPSVVRSSHISPMHRLDRKLNSSYLILYISFNVSTENR